MCAPRRHTDCAAPQRCCRAQSGARTDLCSTLLLLSPACAPSPELSFIVESEHALTQRAALYRRTQTAAERATLFVAFKQAPPPSRNPFCWWPRHSAPRRVREIAKHGVCAARASPGTRRIDFDTSLARAGALLQCCRACKRAQFAPEFERELTVLASALRAASRAARAAAVKMRAWSCSNSGLAGHWRGAPVATHLRLL